MENVIKEGYLNSLLRGVANTGSVQKRYYVLYGPTLNSQARLDYYEDEKAYNSGPKYRKTIYLEEVKQMKRELTSERPHSFIVHMARGENKTYHFSADSLSEMNAWLKAIEDAQAEDKKMRPFSSPNETKPILVDRNNIYEPAEEFQMFSVEIQETEAAKRCNLQVGCPYDLYVLTENFCLVQKNCRVISWNYKHIRRYGCGDSNFTFEAGRKSHSGEGLFSFSVQDGSSLFRTVQQQMKHLQRQKNSDEDEFGRLLRGEPPLPARNHSQSSDDLSPRNSPTTLTPPTVPEHRSSGGSDTAPPHHGPQLPPKPKPLLKIPLAGKNKGKDKVKPATPEKPSLDKLTHRPVLDAAVQDELASKLGVKPPMLKARSAGLPSPTHATAPPVTERTTSTHQKGKQKGINRVSTGEQYELAKSTLHPSDKIRTPSNYTEASEKRVLEPNYIHGGSREEPDYAEYDVAGSLRFQINGGGSAKGAEPEPYYDQLGNYCEAILPNNTGAWEKRAATDDGSAPVAMYDTPADAEPEETSMSHLIAQLNQSSIEPSPSEYDHIGNFNVRPRRVPDDRESAHIYCLPQT